MVTRYSTDNSKEKINMSGLSDLKEGQNKGQLFSLKITNLASEATKVPCNFVFMDKNGDFGLLSVYNNNENLSEEMKNLVQIFVQNPVFKLANITVNKIEQTMPIIQVTDPNTLMIGDKRLSSIAESLAPAEVVNQTFQKKQNK